MKSKKRVCGLLLLLAGILGTVALQRRAQAGATIDATVSITINADGSGTASGAMGNARNSNDTSQFIGCGIHVNGPNGAFWGCGAQNLTSSLSCAVDMNNAGWTGRFPILMGLINPDSFIMFRWKMVNGTRICTSVKIDNDSRYAPKRLP